ncbi:glycosyltransferase family 2 protein [uncultured Clostridium sp.]|uniref:glycosyltransferase family 2 protein n=1 Tax=uncultured Clostridium sp. TaxID=59620 RepID=UPI0025F8D8FA|nr:glycosyltransferase family 2 protein [uncultured Clostridium sp.]
MELISIIVPVYNVEKYLNQCVNTLINQTYFNIEIILVNDGSTDKSGSLCDELSKRDNRIKVIHKKNEGLGLARNTGLEYINGKFVTFIDSDDYVDTNLIEELYYNLKNNNADTCIGGFKRVNDLGKIIFKESYEKNTYEDNYIKNNLLMKMLGSSPEKSDAIRMSVWNVLFSVEIIKNNKLKFVSERKFISEDIIFDIDYYQFAKKVVIIDTVAYNYRVNNESLTRKYKEDRFEKCKILYNEIYSKINFYNNNNLAIYRLQRQYFVNIRVCIKQENIKISKLSYNNAIKNIKKICNDEQLQNIIKNYPINKLGIKQKLFLISLKYKLARIIYIYSIFN